MTVLEAGALSKPLIASNIPAYVECLRDRVDCLIVPREDVAAIVAAVTRLVEDPPFGAALGRALAKMVTSGYSAEQVGESYAEIYRSVVSRTAQRGARSVERSA
jgi:glycosyltransferase involved in cell wall biosynthesis